MFFELIVLLIPDTRRALIVIGVALAGVMLSALVYSWIGPQ